MPGGPEPIALRDTWLGVRLPTSAMARLETIARSTTHAAGDVIIREGDVTGSIGIVTRGRVALRLRVPERGPTTILTVEAGDIIGWSAIVPPHRATSTVVALVTTDVIALDGAALRDAMDADPVLAAAFYRAVSEALARRLTATRMQLLDLFSQQGVEPW